MKHFLITVACCFSLSAAQSVDLNYEGLIDTLKQYKTTNTDWHAGDLLEHTVWVTNAIEKWFYKRSFWVRGLNQGDCRLAMACGFLHDIGKAGDLMFVYKEKPTHPRDGFEYLLHKKPFSINTRERFDFNNWFEANGFSREDQKIVAIITGIHWDFGLVIKKIRDGAQPEPVFEEYLKKLAGFAQEAGYNDGKITKKLLLLSILINAADVKGLHGVDSCCGNQFNLPILPENRAVKNYAYVIHGHKTVGKKIRQQLIDYFDAVWNTNINTNN